MTANVIPFRLASNTEPIISADYFGSEKHIMLDIFSVLQTIKDRDK